MSLEEPSGYISNEYYTPRNLIAKVVRGISGSGETVEFFNREFKQLISYHTIGISGIYNGFNIDDDGSVYYRQSTPIFRFHEKIGLPIDTIFQTWAKVIDKAAKDYNNYSFIHGRSEAKEKENMLLFTVDMIFFELDVKCEYIQNAWLCRNMFPKEYNGSEAYRDLKDLKRTPVEYEVSFYGAMERSDEVNKQAKAIVDEIKNIPWYPKTKEEHVQIDFSTMTCTKLRE